MACKKVGQLCKVVGDRLPVGIDLTDFCERRWDSVVGTGIYTLGAFVRPTPPNRTGFEYEVTQAGQAGVSEPNWPVVIGGTVTSGSVEFTCRAISNSSLLKTIVSVVWDGDGFTVETPSVVNTNGKQLISCFITVDQPPGKYLVVATVTFSDPHIESFGVEVKMS